MPFQDLLKQYIVSIGGDPLHSK